MHIQPSLGQCVFFFFFSFTCLLFPRRTLIKIGINTISKPRIYFLTRPIHLDHTEKREKNKTVEILIVPNFIKCTSISSFLFVFWDKIDNVKTMTLFHIIIHIHIYLYILFYARCATMFSEVLALTKNISSWENRISLDNKWEINIVNTALASTQPTCLDLF